MPEETASIPTSLTPDRPFGNRPAPDWNALRSPGFRHQDSIASKPTANIDLTPESPLPNPVQIQQETAEPAQEEPQERLITSPRELSEVGLVPQNTREFYVYKGPAVLDPESEVTAIYCVTPDNVMLRIMQGNRIIIPRDANALIGNAKTSEQLQDVIRRHQQMVFIDQTVQEQQLFALDEPDRFITKPAPESVPDSPPQTDLKTHLRGLASQAKGFAATHISRRPERTPQIPAAPTETAGPAETSAASTAGNEEVETPRTGTTLQFPRRTYDSDDLNLPSFLKRSATYSTAAATAEPAAEINVEPVAPAELSGETAAEPQPKQFDLNLGLNLDPDISNLDNLPFPPPKESAPSTTAVGATAAPAETTAAEATATSEQNKMQPIQLRTAADYIEHQLLSTGTEAVVVYRYKDTNGDIVTTISWTDGKKSYFCNLNDGKLGKPLEDRDSVINQTGLEDIARSITGFQGLAHLVQSTDGTLSAEPDEPEKAVQTGDLGITVEETEPAEPPAPTPAQIDAAKDQALAELAEKSTTTANPPVEPSAVATATTSDKSANIVQKPDAIAKEQTAPQTESGTETTQPRPLTSKEDLITAGVLPEGTKDYVVYENGILGRRDRWIIYTVGTKSYYRILQTNGTFSEAEEQITTHTTLQELVDFARRNKYTTQDQENRLDLHIVRNPDGTFVAAYDQPEHPAAAKQAEEAPAAAAEQPAVLPIEPPAAPPKIPSAKETVTMESGTGPKAPPEAPTDLTPEPIKTVLTIPGIESSLPVITPDQLRQDFQNSPVFQHAQDYQVIPLSATATEIGFVIVTWLDDNSIELNYFSADNPTAINLGNPTGTVNYNGKATTKEEFQQVVAAIRTHTPLQIQQELALTRSADGIYGLVSYKPEAKAESTGEQPGAATTEAGQARRRRRRVSTTPPVQPAAVAESPAGSQAAISPDEEPRITEEQKQAKSTPVKASRTPNPTKPGVTTI